MTNVTMTVNGNAASGEIPDETLLSEFLREHLRLTGTHIGCDTSQCGACVVHVDGKAVKSCSTLAVSLNGAKVTTIEGLSANGEHPVQKAWVELDVAQCGYCQVGQIMSVASLLDEIPDPSDDDIDRRHTNICRCGTYTRMRKAIHRASDLMKEEAES